MYKTIRLFIIPVILLLSACGVNRVDHYSDEVHNLTSEQLVECYINSYNEKNYAKMFVCLADSMKAKTIDYNSIKTIKLISMESLSINEPPSTVEGLRNELPSTIEELNEVAIYHVECAVEYYDKSIETKNNIYYIGKKSHDYWWLIYDIHTPTHPQ
jgi:hypothetical protein